MKLEEIKKYEKELTIFANNMIKAYEKTNLLKEFCTIKEFKDQKKEFVQTGQWVKLPKDFFIIPSGVAVDNSMISGDFVRSIVNGEKNYILKSILESENIPKYEIEKFNYYEFVNVISKIENPTNIFIPIDPFFRIGYFETFGNKIKFEYGGEPSLLFGNKKIQVHWMTSDTKIREIIVVNKKKIEIIQKTLGDSKPPKEIKKPIEEFSHYSKNKNLMLYFGERDEKAFDCIFKSVISKPKFDERAAIIIDVKNKSKEIIN